LVYLCLLGYFTFSTDNNVIKNPYFTLFDLEQKNHFPFTLETNPDNSTIGDENVVQNIFPNFNKKDQNYINLNENKDTPSEKRKRFHKISSLQENDEEKNLKKEYKKQYRQQYRKQNADVIKEYKKKYQETHVDKFKQYMKKYRETHADKLKENDKKYRERHSEKLKQKHKKYYETYAEKN